MQAVDVISLPGTVGASSGATVSWQMSGIGHADARAGSGTLLTVAPGNRPDAALLSAPSMAVTSDKADYEPGEEASFVLTGISPGSSVLFQLADISSDPGINGIADVYTSFRVTDGEVGDADGLANGTVVAQWQVPVDGSATGAKLQLTATSGSQKATATFSDAPNRTVLENQKAGTAESVWAIHGSIDNIGNFTNRGLCDTNQY